MDKRAARLNLNNISCAKHPRAETQTQVEIHEKRASKSVLYYFDKRSPGVAYTLYVYSGFILYITSKTKHTRKNSPDVLDF